MRSFNVSPIDLAPVPWQGSTGGSRDPHPRAGAAPGDRLPGGGARARSSRSPERDRERGNARRSRGPRDLLRGGGQGSARDGRAPPHHGREVQEPSQAGGTQGGPRADRKVDAATLRQAGGEL